MSISKFVYVSYIRTTPEKLWLALTSPGSIKKYWFEMNVECAWTKGAAWKISSDEGVMDSGKITESIPNRRLALNWRNEWKPDFKAEGESLCIYEIEPIGTSTKLTVTHS